MKTTAFSVTRMVIYMNNLGGSKMTKRYDEKCYM